jgi:hypothetical protein
VADQDQSDSKRYQSILKPKRLAIGGLLVGSLLLYYTIWWGADLDFQPPQGQAASATFTRNGKLYRVTRLEPSGSGQYTLYTVSYLDEQNHPVEQEFATCRGFRLGTDYRLERDRITFFTMHDYHCGLLTTPFNELTRGTKSNTLEFK